MAERTIYVIECDTDDLVKIGSASHLKQRMESLRYDRGTVRTMRLRWAMYGEDKAIRQLEKAVHQRLKGRAKAGKEWYGFDTNGAIQVVKKTAREMDVRLWMDPYVGSTH